MSKIMIDPKYFNGFSTLSEMTINYWRERDKAYAKFAEMNFQYPRFRGLYIWAEFYYTCFEQERLTPHDRE